MSTDTLVYICFLNGYAPSWSDRLIARVAESIRHPIRQCHLKLDVERSYARNRRQYHATLMIAQLLRELPSANAKVIGITSLDLFIPVLTFVFGQSQLEGPAAVVSTHRLQAEYYGLPSDPDRLVERAAKEVIHELGHAFGLVHCREYHCVMRASTYVEEIDLKSAYFCDFCAVDLALKMERTERTA